ncbi:MAG: exonuclease domain-containing protein [Cellulosilyticum sp.]|nr:exonuclease domain-containing protein [Cellulosilyticum sp.]
MYYIIFDLEFNQDFSSLQHFEIKNNHYPFEIIQIAALKLDTALNTLESFNRYVKPYFYSRVCPFITSLTGITTDQLTEEATFPEVYPHFLEFIGDPSAIFCTWGMSDLKELFRNAHYHNLSSTPLPRGFINIQPLVSRYLNFPTKKLLRLEHAVSALDIPKTYPFHNALNDAYYTSEIFKKVYHSGVTPSFYDPTYRSTPPMQPKKQLDTPALLQQFAKMYNRPLTKEEETMIILAYKMGKTHQFLK